MEKCISKYIEKQILKQIRQERNDSSNDLEFVFSHIGVESLIFDYCNGKAYISCFNDEKRIYFDAIVSWLEENDEVNFEIKYIEHPLKEQLLIFHYV